jgi:putative copper export protein
MLPLEAIVSGTSYAVLGLLLGVLVTAGFLLPAGEPKELRQALIISAIYLLIIFLLVAAVALLIQGSKLQGGAIPSHQILFRYVTLTQSGKVWLIRESYGAVLILITLWFLNSRQSSTGVRLLVFLAVPLIVSRSFTSHAVAVREDIVLAVAADAIHLITTSLWGGGLLVLFAVLYIGKKRFALPLSWAAKIVARFSQLALVSVSVLVLTGLYQSWIQVGHLVTIFATTYGNVLLAKIILFLAMLSLGAVNFFSTRRRLLQAVQPEEEISARKKALTRIGAESFLALVVFFVTGLLTLLPPGVHALHQAAIASPTLAQLKPAEGASVKIVSPTRGQAFPTDEVPLSFKLVKGKHGDHVHAYIDGELMGMFLSTEGTLNGIKPGRHVLEVRVVADDHQTELDASDRTEFVVNKKEETR